MNPVTLKTATVAVTPDGIIPTTYYDNADSATSYCCDTPYVSAPSSPGRGGAAPIVGGYFYSAPSSPMHHFLKSAAANSNSTDSSGLLGGSASSDRSSFEFDFGPGVNNNNNGGDDNDEDDRSSTMSSADELFLNGQIRPMKLSSHLQQPQNLAPLIDVDEDEEEGENEGAEIEAVRGRDLKKLRNGSLRRKARSLSPLRTDDVWNDDVEDETKTNKAIDETSKTENPSASSSRSSSGGTSSKRWVFLKDFIRNKSDGSNSNGTNGGRNAARLWSSISFSNHKRQNNKAKVVDKTGCVGGGGGGKLRNGNVVSIKKSAHEVHYTAKRAEAEEMRRKTFLPYKQGLLGCLRFSSKSCHTMDGLARTLNSVSSR